MAEGAAYQDLLAQDSVVSSMLTPDELAACFTLEYYMKNVDFIYERNGI